MHNSAKARRVRQRMAQHHRGPDCIGSDLFMPGARLMQNGLSDHNAAKHRWYYFPKMQMEELLPFKQADSDTTLPGRMTFHTAFVDPITRPDSRDAPHRFR